MKYPKELYIYCDSVLEKIRKMTFKDILRDEIPSPRNYVEGHWDFISKKNGNNIVVEQY